MIFSLYLISNKYSFDITHLITLKNFAKFISKMKEIFYYSASVMDITLTQKFPFVLVRNLAKAIGTENHVCTSCDTVVLGIPIS